MIDIDPIFDNVKVYGDDQTFAVKKILIIVSIYVLADGNLADVADLNVQKAVIQNGTSEVTVNVFSLGNVALFVNVKLVG